MARPRSLQAGFEETEMEGHEPADSNGSLRKRERFVGWHVLYLAGKGRLSCR
jgi:hypothetical protein